MKRIMKYSALVLFVAAVLTSCLKKNYPTPDLQDPPVGTVYTIADLRQVIADAGDPKDYTNNDIFKEHASVYGIVTVDEQSNNCYKYVFIQDRESGKGIELYMKAVTGLRIGDSVRVCLKGATLGVYRGTPQIQNIYPKDVIVLANGKYIEPKPITIAEIESETSILTNYCGTLVTLENVQFNDPSKAWAVLDEGETGNYVNRDLNQYDDNCQGKKTIIVRTSKYASFAEQQLPQGQGRINAIVTLYRTNSAYNWQLLIRGVGANEVLMDGPRCN